MSHIARRGCRWQASYRGPEGRERTTTFALRHRGLFRKPPSFPCRPVLSE